MTDLPIASPSPAPAAAARPSANALLRAALARNGAAQANAVAFQDALALELGLVPDGPPLPGADVPAAAATAGSSSKPGEDTAQAAFAPDAPPGLASAGLPPLPGALAPISPPAFPATAVLQPALASPSTLAVPPAALLQSALACVSPPADSGAAAMPPALAAKGGEHAGLAPNARKDPLARTAAAQMPELQSPTSSAAAEFAAPGQFPQSAPGEIRLEIAFNAGLPEQHEAAPMPSAAFHAGNAAPAQLTQAGVAALKTRVGERGWDQGLGDKLVWMAGQKQQVAELHLNPPDLGPMKITLTLNNDQASAQFVSAHAQVREAIEAAMPRLREMLADNGITLGNASVGTDAFREQAQAQQQQPRGHLALPAAAAADAGMVTRGERLLRQPHGLVDTFA